MNDIKEAKKKRVIQQYKDFYKVDRILEAQAKPAPRRTAKPVIIRVK